LKVVGTFSGAVVTVRLVIGPPAPPDPRLWLDAGTVFGGGILLTIKQEKTNNLIPNDPYASVAATTRPAMEQAVENTVFRPSASVPAGPAPAVPVPPDVAPGEVYPEAVLPEPEFPEPVLAGSSVRGAGEPAGAPAGWGHGAFHEAGLCTAACRGDA
jgi:hypothetical protein